MFQLTRAFTRRVESQNDRRSAREVSRLRQSRPRSAAGATAGGSFSGRGTKTGEYSGLFAVLTCAFILSVTSLTLPGATRAQVLYGSLTGNITDSAGASVPGATVWAVNNGTNVSKETTTNGEGIYQFSDLLPGVYKVTISGTGFTTSVSEGVNIEVNNVRRLDMTLQPGGVSDSVTVNADSQAALQTERADVNVTQTARQVNDLPIAGSAGRNYQSLMQIVPGSVLAGEQNSAAGSPQRSISFNVNGVSRLQNNTKIDGSSITYPWLPTNTAYVPPAEAIQSVNIVTNAFDAEQGMAGGAAVNVIIKSGTNDFHGVGWVYHTNSRFAARNHFQTTPQNPKDLLTQFGYAVGGPILKNKLFFFTDFERTTRRNLSRDNRVSLPTAQLRPDAQGNVRFPTAAEGGATIYDPASNANPALRTPFPNNTIPREPHRPRGRRTDQASAGAEPARLRQQLSDERHGRVQPRQHRHQDQLQPDRQDDALRPLQLLADAHHRAAHPGRGGRRRHQRRPVGRRARARAGRGRRRHVHLQRVALPRRQLRLHAPEARRAGAST